MLDFAFVSRILFLIKYKTFKSIVVDPTDTGTLLVCHAGKVAKIKRRCPHQGARLEEGYFADDCLVCPWHGCYFPLAGGVPENRTLPIDAR